MKVQKYNLRHSSTQGRHKQIKKIKIQQEKQFQNTVQSFGLDNSQVLIQRKKSLIKLCPQKQQNLEPIIRKPSLSEIIEDEKMKSLKQIQSNPFLKQYYNTMISVFMITYTTSQFIVSSIFDIKKQQINLPGLGFLGILVGIINGFIGGWKQLKLKKLAKNILRLAPSPSMFQKKIEFIARKITLNVNKKRQIIGAGFAYQVICFWDRLVDMLPSFQIQIIDSMFQTPQEQLCYRDICFFMNNFLCSNILFERLSHSWSHQQGIHELSFQFLVIEIFCFEIDNGWRLQAEKELQTNKCLLF